jgi:hypothetical protein
MPDALCHSVLHQSLHRCCYRIAIAGHARHPAAAVNLFGEFGDLPSLARLKQDASDRLAATRHVTVRGYGRWFREWGRGCLKEARRPLRRIPLGDRNETRDDLPPVVAPSYRRLRILFRLPQFFAEAADGVLEFWVVSHAGTIAQEDRRSPFCCLFFVVT